MSNTESMKKARNKYEQNVSQVAAKIDKQIYNEMLQYCKDESITKKAFLEAAITYYVDRNSEE